VQGYTLFEIANPVKLKHAKQYIYDGLESGKLVPILDILRSLKLWKRIATWNQINKMARLSLHLRKSFMNNKDTHHD